MKSIILSAILTLFATLFSFAQASKNVFFEGGKKSAIVTGSVIGNKYVDYKLNVIAGQTLSVSINSKSTSIYFNILPPGSKDEAIYNSSIDGNTYSVVAAKSGLYAIRVYLMGAAEKQNKPVNFGLSVGLATPTASKDKLVPGTAFNATGQLRSSKGKSAPNSVMSEFGVKRLGPNQADVYVTYPGSPQVVLRFEKGEWSCLSPGCTLTFTRPSSDEWNVVVNGTYHFSIPDAVIEGG